MGTNGFDKNIQRASEAGKIGGKISKRRSLDKELQDWLLEEVTEGVTHIDAIKHALFKYGMKGNIPAIKELLDRAFGKAVLPIVSLEQQEIIIKLDHEKEAQV